MTTQRWTAGPLALGCLLATAIDAHAQTQVVKPPVAQAWIDVATFSGMGMPGGGGMSGAGGANPMSMMSSVFGGSSLGSKNSFGMTQTASAGRWVDITLATSRDPALAQASQAVPGGTQLAPSLKLVTPRDGRPPRSDDAVDQELERPKGKISIYWGCGSTVRAGQPRVLDLATSKPEEWRQFFVSRRATQRGAHRAAGRPLWPNEADTRMLPDNATLVGEHGFSAPGVPENFRFTIPAAQDLMPPIALRQADAAGATQLDWGALPTARAYFLAATGAKEGADNEIVFWTSSEVPEMGMALVDYQTNPAVDRWLKEKVLLEPGTTRCTVPKGIFGAGGGAMLRMIAYGSELNLAHPPRPSDPKVAWTPDWAVKLRVKSVATAMLGMDMGESPTTPRARAAPAGASEAPAEKKDDAVNPLNLLRGILGR